MTRTWRARSAAALLLACAAVPESGAQGSASPVTTADCAAPTVVTQPVSAGAPRFDPATFGGFIANLRRAIAEARELCEETDDETE